ncbi:MAG: hypothetical protein KGO02_25170, partial [Alphaproteobacteria bacterium]|nr:hypothetical protein [Alphaproteobacteria bacterium]
MGSAAALTTTFDLASTLGNGLADSCLAAEHSMRPPEPGILDSFTFADDRSPPLFKRTVAARMANQRRGAFNDMVDHQVRDIKIEAKPDFLKSLASASPIAAVSELIWNGFDAKA